MRQGDLIPSLNLARDGLRRWPEGERGWRFRLLAAEDLIRVSRCGEAAELLKNQPAAPGLLARWKKAEAELPGASKPADLFAEALGLAKTAGDIGLVSALEDELSQTFPDFDKAETLARQGLADAGRTHDPYYIAMSRVTLGFNRLRLSKFDEAIPYLTQALEIGQRIGARAVQEVALGDLGNCYWRLGDLDRAADLLNRAEKVAGAIGRPDHAQKWLNLIGNVHLAKNEFDEALSFYRRAEGVARLAKSGEGMAIALNNQATTAIAQGDLNAAARYNDQALEIKRKLGKLSSLVYSELNAAQVEALRTDPRGAEKDLKQVAQRAASAGEPSVVWEAYGYLAAFYRKTGRPSPADAAYRAAIATIDQQWDKLSTQESQATFLAPNLLHFFQDYVNFLIDRNEIQRALEMAESSRARALSLQLSRMGAMPALSLAKLQSAARSAHTLILDYWLSPQRSSVWVAGAGKLTRFDLRPRAEIAALVKKHTDTILGGDDPLSQSTASSTELYDAVLGKVRELIPPDANVLIIPDGPLHQLNFGTLVVPGPHPHYWIDDAAVTAAPSLRAIGWAARKSVRDPKLLLIGDPILKGSEFPALPHVQQEVEAVLRSFHGAKTVFTGANAWPGAYPEAHPGDFSYIHFASHAVANKMVPLDSAIILSHRGERFKLYARDVACVPLRARLVTISGCYSANAKAYSGEGLMGFAWAFLAARAENVIASLWDVDDEVSVKLMRGLYTGLARGETPARALRAAQRELIEAGGSKARPYYWGALQAYTRRLE